MLNIIKTKRKITTRNEQDGIAKLLDEALCEQAKLGTQDLSRLNPDSLRALSRGALAAANDPELADEYRLRRFALHLLAESKLERRAAAGTNAPRRAQSDSIATTGNMAEDDWFDRA